MYLINFTYASWLLPNTPMTGLGDPGSFYLNKEGITWHVNNNDYLGKTDKLMTGSSGLLLYWLASDNIGMELSAYQRFITPIIQYRHEEESLNPPLGIFAEGFEPRLAFSYLSRSLKFELSISAEIYGNHEVTRFYRFVHRSLDIVDNISLFPPRKNKSAPGVAGGLGFKMGEHFLFMIYGQDSLIVKQALARLSFRYESGDFQIGMQAEIARQLGSDFYIEDDLEEYRSGGGISMKWDWYQFAVSYQSTYLKFDRYDQYYIDPIIISYEF